MDIDYNTDNSIIKRLSMAYFVDMTIMAASKSLYEEFTKELLCDFFLNHNFGTRQSKGFGSFYIDEDDEMYMKPRSEYHFSISISEKDIEKEWNKLFQTIELFYKTLRGGVNVKNKDKQTIFYFKSMAFMYAKDKLQALWDKRTVKGKFYNEGRRYKPDKNGGKCEIDSLDKQIAEHKLDNDNEPLTYKADKNIDIRDLLGLSTNEEWLSFGDSLEKKVAIVEGNKCSYPKKDEKLPVERMRSPLLFKPICRENKKGVYYDIYLVFQDELVGMDDFKKQLKMCFFSKKEKDNQGRPKRFMIDIPSQFSMEDYFDYIFNELEFDISSHVETQYQNRAEYEILEDIYSQIKENLQ